MKLSTLLLVLFLVAETGNSQIVTNTIRNCALNNGVYTFEIWSQASQSGIAPSQGLFQVNFTFGALTSPQNATFSTRFSVLGSAYIVRGTSGARQYFQVWFGTSPGPSAEITTSEGGEHIFTVSCTVANPETTAGLSWQITGGWYWVTNVFAGGDDRALPIQLSSFAVNAHNRSAALTWVTASEIDNYGFYVQRGFTADNLADAEDGFVAGHGTSLEPHEYSWTDKSPATYYRLRQVDLDGSSSVTDVIAFTPTAIESNMNSPATFALGQNYPNPFNPSTTITFELPVSSDVRLSVFDMLGREVAILVNDHKNAGMHEVMFSTSGGQDSNLASGVYFYRLQAGEFVESKTLVVLK